MLRRLFRLNKEKVRNEWSSMVAALNKKQIIAPLTFEGHCNKEVFEAWFEQFLTPNLKPGQTVNMDTSVKHWDDTNIENLTKVFLKSESNEKKKEHIIHHNKGYFGKIRRCRTDNRKYSKCSIYYCKV